MKLHPFILRPVLVLAALLSMAELAAQSPGLVVYGTVRDLTTRDSIPFPTVLVAELGSQEPPLPIVSNARGRYEIDLTEQKTYLISYSAPGKVIKTVQLELLGPSAEEWGYGFGMHIDITLLDSLPGLDYSILSEPFGIARFNTSTDNYEWDVEYTRSRSDRQKALLNEYLERVQQEENRR